MTNEGSDMKPARNTGKKMFNCNLCPKNFETKQTAKQHIEGVHVETPQYGCIICEHKSKTKASLNQHVSKVHTAATPETCQVCKKVVRRLYSHNYYHHGEKRFPCTICGRK